MKTRTIHHVRRTSESPLTSADCSFFLFPAAWRNPPGTDAAAYYHPLSVRKTEKKHTYQTPPDVLIIAVQQLCIHMYIKSY